MSIIDGFKRETGAISIITNQEIETMRRLGRVSYELRLLVHRPIILDH